MKYLRTKHSRRRGVAIELAMMLLLVMTAMSIMLVSTTMIQINKQKESTSDLTEIVDEIKKMEYDNVGKYFKQLLVQNINTTNENDIVTVDYITTKINEKYSTYFNERNLSFLVEVTDQGQTEEPFTNDDVITEQSVVQTEEEITYQNSDLEDVPSDSTSIEYVIHKVTETEFITYQLMKSSGKTEQITEGFNLKIFEKKDNELDQSNVLYEITISRRYFTPFE